MKDDIIKVGSALTKQGFKPGDVVTIFSPNCPEFAIIYLAVIGIGGVVSTVNPVYSSGIAVIIQQAFCLKIELLS